MKPFADWRDANEYPADSAYSEPEFLADDFLYTSKAWAWQFLRRSGQYQADYDASRTMKERSEITNLAAKHGLSFFLPYSVKEPCAIPFLSTYAVRSPEHDIEKGKPLNLKATEMALIFDIRFPIEIQLKLARAQIEEKSELLLPREDDFTDRKRKRKGVFGRYLRVLDARHCGVSFDEIAKRFSGEGLYQENEKNGYSCKKNAEQDYSRAKKLTEQGYRGIAYS